MLMTVVRWRMRGRAQALRVIGGLSKLQQRMIFLKNLEWTSSNLRKEISSLCQGSVLGGARQFSQIKFHYGQTVGIVLL